MFTPMAGRSQGTQDFNGPGTFTVPYGVTEVVIVLVGGGGGSGQFNSPGGGGGGEVVIGTLPVSPGQVITIVEIGAGGSVLGDGGQTTITLPSTQQISAQGGFAGVNGVIDGPGGDGATGGGADGGGGGVGVTSGNGGDGTAGGSHVNGVWTHFGGGGGGGGSWNNDGGFGGNSGRGDPGDPGGIGGGGGGGAGYNVNGFFGYGGVANSGGLDGVVRFTW